MTPTSLNTASKRAQRERQQEFRNMYLNGMSADGLLGAMIRFEADPRFPKLQIVLQMLINERKTK